MRNKTPTKSGWYAICQWTCEDFRNEEGPYTKPEVIYYDGNSDYVCYDPDGPKRGGIQDISSVAMGGLPVPNKAIPAELKVQ